MAGGSPWKAASSTTPRISRILPALSDWRPFELVDNVPPWRARESGQMRRGKRSLSAAPRELVTAPGGPRGVLADRAAVDHARQIRALRRAPDARGRLLMLAKRIVVEAGQLEHRRAGGRRRRLVGRGHERAERDRSAERGRRDAAPEERARR